ncbi:MAG: hypothetical protein JXA13_10010 [Anaerolineales bacterium]|nr:hypothetical protein [Anaerolineales bacterium]
MMMQMPFPTLRGYAFQLFETLRRSAWRRNLFTGKQAGLESISDYKSFLNHTRQYLGLQEIPLSQITGTVNRTKDFDRNFMPRKKHLCERWVSIYLTSERSSWSAIRLYKIGPKYFVEDGHHRVSVANTLNMKSILSEVWEYPTETYRWVGYHNRSLCCSAKQLSDTSCLCE